MMYQVMKEELQLTLNEALEVGRKHDDPWLKALARALTEHINRKIFDFDVERARGCALKTKSDPYDERTQVTDELIRIVQDPGFAFDEQCHEEDKQAMLLAILGVQHSGMFHFGRNALKKRTEELQLQESF